MDIVLKQLSQTSDILTQGFSTAGLRLSKSGRGTFCNFFNTIFEALSN